MYTKYIELLKNVEIFEGIDESELNNMLGCLSPNIVNYKKKEYIAIAENEFIGIGVVVEGEVFITKENAAGDRMFMAKLKEGSIFGEIIAFSNRKTWPSTVMAETDCTIFFLSPENIIGNCPKMCGGHTMLIQNMLKIVSQRALMLNKKVEYLSIKSIRGKIATYLLEHYNAKGTLTFNIPLNRNQLAEFLNISRPSLSREIIKMQEEEIFEFCKSSFKIIDIEKLKQEI